jgi:signal peptidase I
VTSLSDHPVPDAKDGAADAEAPTAARRIGETVVIVLIALIVAVLLRLFVVQTYSIPSRSMEPTLQVGDRIAVDKLSYAVHGVHRGDIVVFSTPPNEHCGGPVDPDLVKRVVGLPGETISLSGHGYLQIDGKQIDESWLPTTKQGTTYPGPPGTAYSLARPYRIPANEYFVMGDNRRDSCDSRFWGPIPGSLIVGKVDARFWPLSRLHLF